MIRVLTTVLLAAGVLAAIWHLSTFTIQLFILIAIFLGLQEYAKLVFEDRLHRIFTVILGTAFAAWVSWAPSFSNLLGGLVVAIFLSFLVGFTKKEPLGGVTASVGLTVLGICYLSLTLPYWGWIHAIGREWVYLLLFPACLTDTFGFLVGKAIGKRKLAPAISPNKTWEGFFGSLVGAVFGIWLAAKLFFPYKEFSWGWLISVGCMISILAVFGDLIESLIKRSAGVKDSSHLIPGHGGALDRLDALVFVAPAFYMLLKNTNILL